MPTSARFLYGRSQHFTFLRREFLQKAASASLLFLVPRPLHQHSMCAFRIGDEVAERWIDEFDNERIEYGEVCGICWHPKEREWACLINWTKGDSADNFYPCFDEQLVPARDLRLVSYA